MMLVPTAERYFPPCRLSLDTAMCEMMFSEEVVPIIQSLQADIGCLEHHDLQSDGIVQKRAKVIFS